MKRNLIPVLVSAALVIAALADVALGTGVVRAVIAFLGFVEPAQEDKVYWCPMHPFYKVRRYGICPYCNMALEEYKGQAEEKDGDPSLILTDQQVQQAGVRTEKVSRRNLVRETATSGILEPNHEKYWHISTRFQGWVQELFIHQAGERVKVGQPIARIYSPELYASQKEYLLVRNDPALARSARRRLELLGVGEAEIKALEERGEPASELTIRAPFEGAVTHLNVELGMKLPEDGHIADIADLRELWIFADVFGREMGSIELGQEARIQVDALPGETFLGKLDLIEPKVRPETQASRVRIRVPNDPVKLLPGQFARVLLLNKIADTLAVSEQAVIPTGRRDLVIVAMGGGRFTAREVELGKKWLTEVRPERDPRGLPFFTGHSRYHEVRSGLKEAEEVVTSGAFLLHAETQIRQLIEKMLPPAKDRPANPRSAWSGRRITEPLMVEDLAFANDDERKKYEANPDQSWSRRFPSIFHAMHNVFDQYLLIHEAVVQEKLALAAEYAEGLSGMLAALSDPISPAFDSGEADRIRAVTDTIAKAAARIRGAADMKQLQGRFGELSAGIELWVETFGPPYDRVHQFYCGMAKKTVESPTERWFQKEAELRNPFGMEGCGSLEKIVERARD
jgi:multidrug efflux pump subunit AcrA (membrane-fusion protein)